MGRQAAGERRANCTRECVLLRENVFSYERMSSLTRECVLLRENVFSTRECVLLLQNGQAVRLGVVRHSRGVNEALVVKTLVVKTLVVKTIFSLV